VEKAKSMASDLQADATDALEQLRDLARGIYPPLLADQGLVAALEAQARKASVPTEVRSDGIGRYPQDIETAVYFCVLAFAVAIPLLAALVMVNRQEAFRARRTPSVMVTVAQAVAQSAAFVGIVAGFWHITWVAGVTFLVAGLVAVGIHSAGFWRLEETQEPTSEDRG
jgi:hypothetical protein